MRIGFPKKIPPPIDQSCVGYWKFDESSGTIKDWSGNGNIGTAYNLTYSQPGKFGNAANFNGSTSYVNGGNGASLNLPDAVTVEAWIKTAAFGTNQYRGIVGRKSGAITDGCGFQYGLSSSWTTGDKIVFWAHTEGTTDCSTQFNSLYTLSINTWYHIVGTYDSITGYQKIYINGVLNSTINRGTGTKIRSFSNQPLIIGTNPQGYWFFNGTIDEARIYNRALSVQEIKRHYLTGR